jgi:glycosyltransferase involved in cell wall biosynthesis
MEGLARELNLGGQVRFAGLVANEDVPDAMRAADAVVIPSRHEYAEGLPLTIYEALAARTPIIASDHPMFRGALTHDESALVFPAKDIGALASAIRRLASDADLYARLSANSDAAWQALQLPVTWGALIERWLSDSADDREWIREHRLTSGVYDQEIAVRRPRRSES